MWNHKRFISWCESASFDLFSPPEMFVYDIYPFLYKSVSNGASTFSFIRQQYQYLNFTKCWSIIRTSEMKSYTQWPGLFSQYSILKSKFRMYMVNFKQYRKTLLDSLSWIHQKYYLYALLYYIMSCAFLINMINIAICDIIYHVDTDK